MYDANVKATGGYISGEVKLAIALRMLAGGDSYDLAVILMSTLIIVVGFFKKYY